MLITTFNYIGDIEMTLAQARSASHSGSCDGDVAELLRVPEIMAQLLKIDKKKLAKELKEYGAWDAKELRDTPMNFTRIVWIAAGNIMDEWRERGGRAMTDEEYVKNNPGGYCPVCNGGDTEGGPVEIDGPTCWSHVECHECGSEWNDLYTLSGIGEMQNAAKGAINEKI